MVVCILRMMDEALLQFAWKTKSPVLYPILDRPPSLSPEAVEINGIRLL